MIDVALSVIFGIVAFVSSIAFAVAAVTLFFTILEIGHSLKRIADELDNRPR